MAKRMLIDASHLEETRVVMLSGNRLEDFDYESASKKPLKGNIYLAKITRVEPSLQAAFVEYGGNRHGFLPFSEIHPDYYRIPIADRKALIKAEAAAEADEEDREPATAEGEPTEPVETAEGGAEDGAEDRDEQDQDEAAGAPGNGAGEPADGEVEEVAVETGVDTVGGDEVEDAARRRARLMRRYKIQEVIKRRQIILVQVTKEERGNKGAALTTYLSLAGRYCVLMPNTARGGGISRKISSAKDRRRLKRVVGDLEIPEGVAVIVRTAGSERTKAEIRRDYEYLLRQWSEIRETTLASTAPALIYEEASLIKRTLRDLYQTDMDEILVEGDDGYKAAKAFMKSLMPSHARKVKQFKDETVPLFYRYQIESQIDAMHNAVVQLKSGGYIVINMTEALVAIDVNSGKATRERHIEETAYKTNLEASEEIARQLRLRDLAGLIVIDYIDMEESRHNRSVERKLKEAMRSDRARIQLGRISPFGLLEMSRQRLRPSLFETSTVVCPQCNATGFVRTTESVALHVLRDLEEEGIKRGGGEIAVTAPPAVALHVLNALRERLVEVEHRYALQVNVEADETLTAPDYAVRRHGPAAKRAAAEEEAEEKKAERKRGRGRRRRRRDEEAVAEEELEAAEEEAEAEAAEEEAEVEAAEEERPKRRRRRGKRGGRRRSRRRPGEEAVVDEELEAGAAEEEEELEAEAAEEEEEPEAEAAEEEEEPEAEAAEPAPEEAKPRRRRARSPRRRKPAAEAEPSEAGPAEAGPSEEPAPEEVQAEAEATEPKPKRRRSRARPKKAAVPVEVTIPEEETAPEEEAVPEEAAGAEPEPAPEPEPIPETQPAPEPETAAEPTAEPAPERLPEPVGAGPAWTETATGPATAEEPGAPGDEDEDQPRRRGWWQRWG
jgi:ribonuclease E